MTKAIIFGSISGLSLIIGSLVGTKLKLQQKAIATLMAFGAGVLICALTFGLAEKSYFHGGLFPTIFGLALGGFTFVMGDYLLHLAGARKHRRIQIWKTDEEVNGKVITLGAILDGLPESVALGITLFGADTNLSILMLVAIFLANFPESLSSVTGLKKEGFTKRKINIIWLVVGIITVFTTVSSYVFLYGLSWTTLAVIESFAAGSILALLANAIMPEAYEEGGFQIGMATVAGFLLAFVITKI